MVKAIVAGGGICPLEPLPSDWKEGQAVYIQKADDPEAPADEIDRDFAMLGSMCEARESADEEQMQTALQAAKLQAKEQVRRQMGLE